MKTLKKLSILLLFMISLTGCNTLSTKTLYALDNNNIEFSLPKVWEQIDSNENDLALSRPTAKLVIDTYRQSELDGISAEELLDKKVNERMKELKDSKVVKKFKVNEWKDRKIYSVLYSATKDNIESQYYFSVMEFTGTHTYVYALYEEKEMYMKYNIDDIQRMLLLMKWNGKEEDLVLN